MIVHGCTYFFNFIQTPFVNNFHFFPTLGSSFAPYKKSLGEKKSGVCDEARVRGVIIKAAFLLKTVRIEPDTQYTSGYIRIQVCGTV